MFNELILCFHRTDLKLIFNKIYFKYILHLQYWFDVFHTESLETFVASHVLAWQQHRGFRFLCEVLETNWTLFVERIGHQTLHRSIGCHGKI